MSLVFGYSQLIYESEQNPPKKLERPSSSPALASQNQNNSAGTGC